ncbi:MAG: 50S ribosomal protein L24e [Nanoarchaeota archaeon]
MATCNFCGETIRPGTGKKYIKNDGKIWDFCSSKCQKNQVKLKRVNRNVRWTKAAHTLKRQVKP